MWTQIVGKIRMTLSPPLNHWWHVSLYVTASGLTTGPVPYLAGVFEIQFDFLKHEVRIGTSESRNGMHPLHPETVAHFYRSLIDLLESLGIHASINTRPQELAVAVPFEDDDANCSYDPRRAHDLWRILVSSATVFERFRGKFIGKCSPVHFFWGSFDLACTRFSGRPAPLRKGIISGSAYSHEVWSGGFWPGGSGIEAAYYAYAVPRPAGLENERIRPAAAAWNAQLAEFILPYEDVRTAASPGDYLYEFLESTFEATARLAAWPALTC